MGRDMDCLRPRSYSPIRVFFPASCSWRSEGLSCQSFSIALPVQALRGLPCLGSFSVVRCIRQIEGPPPLAGVLLCSSVPHVFDGPGSIVQLRMPVCGEREAMVMAPPPPHDSAVSPCFRGCPAFLHMHFPPQSPSSHPYPPPAPIFLSAVNSSPHSGIAPQSLNSSSQLLHLPGDQRPCPGYVWLQQGLSDSHPL